MRLGAAGVAIAIMSAYFTFAQKPPCVSTLAECPATGCAPAGNAEASANAVRRKFPPRGNAARLTISDFERLQMLAERVRPQGFAVADRKPFQKLLRRGRFSVGEGDLVEISGYIIGTPHARVGDSANCRLVGRNNNSFRLNIAEGADEPEIDSIIVELIPHRRPQTWSLMELRRLARQRKMVLIRGALFYDSSSRTNSDPVLDRTGYPKRLSLWEIHPVTEIFVCIRGEGVCRADRPADWRSIGEVR